MIWYRTAAGRTLHRPGCQHVNDFDTCDQAVVMTRRDACAWMRDRPLSCSLCAVCRPADPRLTVVQ